VSCSAGILTGTRRGWRFLQCTSTRQQCTVACRAFSRSSIGSAHHVRVNANKPRTLLAGTSARAIGPPRLVHLSIWRQILELTKRQLQATVRAPDFMGLRIGLVSRGGRNFSPCPCMSLRSCSASCWAWSSEEALLEKAPTLKTSPVRALLPQPSAPPSAYPCMTIFVTGVPLYSRQRAPFYRESAAALYSPFAYSIATLIAELPWLLLCTLVFEAVFFPIIGLHNTAEAFFSYVLVHFGTFLFFNLFAQASVAILPSEPIAQVMMRGVNSVGENIAV